jgi:hypothetical protein
MFDNHLGGHLPLLAQGAALRQCEHVVADLTDGTQGPAILGRYRPGELLSEIRRGRHSALRHLGGPRPRGILRRTGALRPRNGCNDSHPPQPRSIMPGAGLLRGAIFWTVEIPAAPREATRGTARAAGKPSLEMRPRSPTSVRGASMSNERRADYH